MKQSLKAWVIDEMERFGCTEGMAYRRAHSPGMRLARADGRALDVVADNRPAAIRQAVRPVIPAGAVQMKTWRAEQAAALGLSESAIAMRIHRGQMQPKTCVVNARVVYVIP